MPALVASRGDAHAAIDDDAGGLDSLLGLAAAQEAAGAADAPWPPHFEKAAGEGPRVAPSRARKPRGPRTPRTGQPLILVARAKRKDDALAGLERWRGRHAAAAARLAPDDVLVDTMRGRSSAWYRVRVNLRHVPEDERPPAEPPDPDWDPAEEWRGARKPQP